VAVFVSLEPQMSLPVFGGRGRPAIEESERRRREFIRLLGMGTPFKDARRAAKISGDRALELLWEQRELCHLDGILGGKRWVIGIDPEAEAA
jgi:hypothetical protein